MKKLLAGLLVAGMLSITTSPVLASYAGIKDIDANYWAKTEIASVVGDSVMFTSNGKFNPEQKISRVDFVTALLKVLGQSNSRIVSDVAFAKLFHLVELTPWYCH